MSVYKAQDTTLVKHPKNETPIANESEALIRDEAKRLETMKQTQEILMQRKAITLPLHSLYDDQEIKDRDCDTIFDAVIEGTYVCTCTYVPNINKPLY